jgi:hypothetical protein
MVVVAGQFLYDVTDPVHPILTCRAENTYLRLLGGNAIGYTTVVTGTATVAVRRDLTTGAVTSIGDLRISPQPYYYAAASWTSDGLFEVYATSSPASANGLWKVQVHLWAYGADHVLYTIDAGPGGLESRWAAHSTLEFSPDHTYVAVSDSNFSLLAKNVRIFSLADQRQVFVTATSAFGGTWTADDRFIWATGSGLVMQWTRSGGATAFRSERWFGPTSSPGGQWMAATLLTDADSPHVVLVAADGGRTHITGPGSSPGFVSSTKVWYAEEAPCPSSNQCAADPTAPTRIVRAYDLSDGSDQVVVFRAGEEPGLNGFLFCCGPRT